MMLECCTFHIWVSSTSSIYFVYVYAFDSKIAPAAENRKKKSSSSSLYHFRHRHTTTKLSVIIKDFRANNAVHCHHFGARIMMNIDYWTWNKTFYMASLYLSLFGSVSFHLNFSGFTHFISVIRSKSNRWMGYLLLVYFIFHSCFPRIISLHLLFHVNRGAFSLRLHVRYFWLLLCRAVPENNRNGKKKNNLYAMLI